MGGLVALANSCKSIGWGCSENPHGLQYGPMGLGYCALLEGVQVTAGQGEVLRQRQKGKLRFMWLRSTSVRRILLPLLTKSVQPCLSLAAALTGFWVLCFMWLKFATIWRFFRLAALLDGIEPPENMSRCFANNYDVEVRGMAWGGFCLAMFLLTC